MFPDAGKAANLVCLVAMTGARRYELVDGPWSPQLRIQVADGMVTIVVSGVLDAHVAAMTRAEVLSVCGLATAVTLDLRAVYQLQLDAGVRALLDDCRSRCMLARCRLQVTATDPQVLQALKLWGTESNTWRAACRTRSTGVR